MKNLIEIANNVSKSEFAFIDYTSDKTKDVTKTLAKSFGYSGTITKRTRTEVIFGASYQSAVRLHLYRMYREQGMKRKDALAKAKVEFTARPLSWGEWFIDNKVITHKGNYYLRAYTFKGGKTEKDVWYCDGVEITNEDAIKAFVEKCNKNNGTGTQAAAGLNPEDQVSVIAVRFDSINEFNAHKMHYTKSAVRLVAE